jgi:hypothetical protein
MHRSFEPNDNPIRRNIKSFQRSIRPRRPTQRRCLKPQNNRILSRPRRSTKPTLRMSFRQYQPLCPQSAHNRSQLKFHLPRRRRPYRPLLQPRSRQHRARLHRPRRPPPNRQPRCHNQVLSQLLYRPQLLSLPRLRPRRVRHRNLRERRPHRRPQTPACRVLARPRVRSRPRRPARNHRPVQKPRLRRAPKLGPRETQRRVHRHRSSCPLPHRQDRNPSRRRPLLPAAPMTSTPNYALSYRITPSTHRK